MDLVNAELLVPYRLAAMWREAERDRLIPAPERRRPPLAPLAAFAGRRLVRAGTWLECLGQPCPCPAPAATSRA